MENVARLVDHFHNAKPKWSARWKGIKESKIVERWKSFRKLPEMEQFKKSLLPGGGFLLLLLLLAAWRYWPSSPTQATSTTTVVQTTNTSPQATPAKATKAVGAASAVGSECTVSYDGGGGLRYQNCNAKDYGILSGKVYNANPELGEVDAITFPNGDVFVRVHGKWRQGPPTVEQ